MENFKLKEFEKTAEAGGHSACVLTLHTLPFSPQRGHKTFMRGALPIPNGKEWSYL